MAIELIIIVAQCVFFCLIIYGCLFKRTFLAGRWFYRSDGRSYWYVMLFHIYAFSMLVYFFGWKIFI
jgi:hypothetical protein